MCVNGGEEPDVTKFAQDASVYIPAASSRPRPKELVAMVA